MPEKDGARITPPSVRGFPPENDEKGRFLRNRSFFARLFAVSVPFGLLCAFSLFADFLNFSLRPAALPSRFLPSLRLRFPALPSSSRPSFFFFLRCPSVPPLSLRPCVVFLFLRCPSVSPLSLRPCVVLPFLRCPCPFPKALFFPVCRPLPFPLACGLFPFLLLSFAFLPDFLPFPRDGPAPSFYFLFYY